MNKTSFAKKIVDWYMDHHRNLPWRETGDPYKIWLSEIILQQTRVAQGLPYYLRFIARFPNVFALARASEQDVLRLWQGLGYYTRARNLHQCAKIIAERYRGEFPDGSSELKKLPGIGPYTAAAIASIAFGESIAVVDGNVYRVLARIFGIEKDISTQGGKTYFAEKANELISLTRPDLFNQAMMEFGATHCLPRNPKCDDCIFFNSCVARVRQWQDRLPVKSKIVKIRKRFFYYFVIRQNKKWLMNKREGKDIWRGLFDFYLIERNRSQNPERLFEQDEQLLAMRGKLLKGGISLPYKHILTHQKLNAWFISVDVPVSASRRAWFKSKKMKLYSSKEIDRLPKPELITRYLLERGLL
jgi:A/G-specific adenine glycosylase